MKKLISIVLTVALIAGIVPAVGASDNVSYTYPTVSQADVISAIEACQSGGHPYLFGRDADFERVRQAIADGDEFITKQYDAIKRAAAHDYDSIPTFDRIESSVLSQSGQYIGLGFECWQMVMRFAFVYLIEGDERYAKKAYTVASYFAALDSWNNQQSISNNQAAFCVALCYDWLYDYLDDTQRSTLKNALLQNHLNIVSDLFKNPSDYSSWPSPYTAYWGTGNHTALNNSSVIVQAIAVADDSNNGFYADLITTALGNLSDVFDSMYPDSGWYEGVSYWGYVGPFIARMLSGFESAFGTCFGYENVAHIVNCSDFPMYAQTNEGYFRVGDVSQGKDSSPEKYYLALLRGDVGYQKAVLGGSISSASPLLCLWYDTDADYENASYTFAKDKLFSDINMAVFRNTWETDEQIFAGLKVSKAVDTHNNMDSGTFVLDALGERWITNPGEDNYNLPGYWESEQNGRRWNYYTKRAEGNSCLVINPSSSGGQRVDANDQIDEFESSGGFAYAIADLTDTYADGAASYKRGAALTHDRSRFVIRDEAVLKASSDVYSFINVYQSDITITPDDKAAILSKGDKHVYVKIVSDAPYELSVTSAASLSTSPARHADEMDYTKDYQRIAIRFDDVTSLNVSMTFVPFLDESELDGVGDDILPLSQWGSALATETMPKLNSLKVNGSELSGFNPYVRTYEYPSPVSHLDITATADDADVEVARDEYSYKIIVSNDELVNVYVINVPLQGQIIADAHMGGNSSADSSLGVFNIYHAANFGRKETVVLRNSQKYSVTSFYKISLPELSDDYEYKKVILSLNQYRILGSANNSADTIGFYNLPFDSWQENTINYNNAPLRHRFDNSTWYPFLYRNEDGTYTQAATESLSYTRSPSVSLAKGTSPSDGYYARDEYDITALANAKDFSFMMAVTSLTTFSDYFAASKEHSNPSLRPSVRVVVGKKSGAPAIRATNVEFTDTNNTKLSSIKAEDECRASVFAGNDTSVPQQITLYLASYSDDELINIKSITRTVPQGGAELATPLLKLNGNADKIRAFVCKADMTPLVMSHQSEMEVSQ
ncbi:MAG: heparinase II/III family protein [Clostridia bacterium]|nr:heparinase II/III family protein [Clostridia bacterium]